MEYQYPSKYNKLKGSHEETCTVCKMKKKINKDCERCRADQENRDSDKEIKDLTDNITKTTETIETLKQQNLANQEQIKKNQDQNETLRQQNLANQKQIKILELSVESDRLSLEIQTLKSKFGVEVVSEDVRVHNGIYEGKPVSLETHCTIVRVAGHEDVYFGHVTLVITYSDKTLGEYKWHYGVKVDNKLPQTLNHEFWQTYYKDQEQYSYDTLISDFGRFKRITNQTTNPTLLDMMKSHFKDCITFFYNKPDWPTKQVWGTHHDFVKGETATDSIERLKFLKDLENKKLDDLKSSQSDIDKSLTQKKREQREEERLERLKQHAALIEQEEQAKHDRRIQNLNDVEKRKKDKKDKKRQEAEWEAARAKAVQDASLAQSVSDKAKAKASKEASLAESVSDKPKAAKAESNKVLVATQESKNSGSGSGKKDVQSTDDFLSQAVEQAKAEHAKAEEKLTLEIPPITGKKSNRECRKLSLLYQQTIDSAYKDYLNFKNLKPSAEKNNLFDEFRELQKYVMNVVKYIEKVEQQEVTRKDCSSYYDLVVNQKQKTLEFLKMKISEQQVNTLLEDFLQKYCSGIVVYIQKLEKDFTVSEESLIKLDDTCLANLITDINKSIAKCLVYKKDLETLLPNINSGKAEKLIIDTLNFLDQYKKKFEDIDLIVQEQLFIYEIKYIQEAINININAKEELLKYTTDQEEIFKIKRFLIKKYRGFIERYKIYTKIFESMITKFQKKGVDIQKISALYEDYKDIWNITDPVSKYMAYSKEERPNIISFYKTNTDIDNESDMTITENLCILVPEKFKIEDDALEFVQNQRELKLKQGISKFSTKDILEVLRL